MPYAAKPPSGATITIAKPAALYSTQFPSSIEPSKYQMCCSSLSGGGGNSQLNHPSMGCAGRGKRMTSKPRVRSMLARFGPTCLMAMPAFLGLRGHPSGGLVHTQSCLCSSVPGAARHSWHLSSVIPHRGTEARRVCVHWPPEIADAKWPFILGCHIGTLATFSVRPLSKLCNAPAKSTNMLSSMLLAPPADPTASHPCGC